MRNLQVPPRDLTDDELVEALRYCTAVLAGAAHKLYDHAIALAVESSIIRPTVKMVTGGATWLHERQRELPRIEAKISSSWVDWAASTRENWDWLLWRLDTLQESYKHRFKQQPPWHLAVRRLWLTGPRPRAAGRTNFPTHFPEEM